MNVQLLEELGFTEASKELEKKLAFKKKMMIAYENFKFVTPAIFNRFNIDLKRRTIARKGKKGVDLTEKYDQLVFQDVAKIRNLPPKSVLASMKKAKDLGCFDKFVVAKIESVVDYKDPIVFGVITGCDDMFFVDQWDNDVKISDILKGLEG